ISDFGFIFRSGPMQDGTRVMSRRAKLLAAGVMAGAAIAIAASCFKSGPPPESPAEDKNGKQHLFRDWPEPDLVLIFSGQQHGYLDPCGCSRPQIGGLVRRYNFMQGLKERGWPIDAVDAGDIAQRKAPAGLPNIQGLLKYKKSMEALQRMDY